MNTAYFGLTFGEQGRCIVNSATLASALRNATLAGASYCEPALRGSSHRQRFWDGSPYRGGPQIALTPGRPQIIWTGIFGCRLILRSRNVLTIYEMPSSNEDQMEFRYNHWCGQAERGRTRAPPCRRHSGGTSYGAGGPVMARRNCSPMRPDHNPQPGPL